jgi:NTE family protein
MRSPSRPASAIGFDARRIMVEPAAEPVYYQDGPVARYVVRTGNGIHERDVRDAMRHVARRQREAGVPDAGIELTLSARWPCVARALGGGSRGLVHIGVLQVLEHEGIAPGFVAGTSIGGLIGALHASGLRSKDLVQSARRFRFLRWFLPGGLLAWGKIFPSAAEALPATFEDLSTPLAFTAVDLEEGIQIVLHAGGLLPAVRATCALPGVLPPEHIDGRWLVDGGVTNALPVDVAWMADPDLLIALRVGAPATRRMPQLAWGMTRLLSRLGRIVPNPATAKLSFEILARATEIVLEPQTALSAAMTDPEIQIEPELGAVGLRDFDRSEDAVAAGRRAAQAALPGLAALLASPRRPSAKASHRVSPHSMTHAIRPTLLD